ncbi:hypothetical protein [Actinokineospora sp.]|uniref:sunset domain-containing protein n=1 Tax=Actinokineospora sp. TaxID=1872133 RepID=UPI003D6ABD9E
MKYLFGQVWLWLLLSFLLGALFTWLVQRFFRKPKVEVTEERIGGPAVKESDRKAKDAAGKDAAGKDKVSASARPRASALGALDDDERTGTLRADDTPGDDTPTGRIPVQTLDDTVRSGTLTGSLDDEPKSDPAKGKSKDKAKHKLADDHDSAKTEWMAAPPPSMEEGNRDTLPAKSDDEAVSDVNVSGTVTSGAAATGVATGSGADGLAGTGPVSDTDSDVDSDSDSESGSGKGTPMFATSAVTEAPAATDEPYGPGSARPGPGGASPSPEYTIKGNADSMLFHTTDSPYYGRTKAEVWFKTAADAERAGFAPWTRSKREVQAAVAKPTWEAGEYAGSAKPKADGTPPTDEFKVKGNVDSMLFHTEESAFYSVTKAEVWFRDADEAEAAGFRPWNRVGGAERGQTEIPQQAVARVPEGPFGPNSANPKADGSAPSDEFTIKGNADSMLFHTTESPYYPRTRAEVWFKSAADAEQAGFTAWNKRRSEKI